MEVRCEGRLLTVSYRTFRNQGKRTLFWIDVIERREREFQITVIA
jgi:hypothetical protein